MIICRRQQIGMAARISKRRRFSEGSQSSKGSSGSDSNDVMDLTEFQEWEPKDVADYLTSKGFESEATLFKS